MKRNYTNFDLHLDALLEDIYPQPADKGHLQWTKEAIAIFIPSMKEDANSVLDVGCGQGVAKIIFEEVYGWEWSGVTLGKEDLDVIRANKFGGVYEEDMSFLPFADESFDCVYARHVLEHSPFPLISLMEWARVSRKYLILVAPAPDYWGVKGKNHYAVLYRDQLGWLLARAGWKVVHDFKLTTHDPTFYENVEGDWKKWATDEKGTHPALDVEYRLFCTKKEQQLE